MELTRTVKESKIQPEADRRKETDTIANGSSHLKVQKVGKKRVGKDKKHLNEKGTC